MKISLSVIAGPHQGKSFEFSEHDNFLVGRGSQAHFRLPKDDPFFSRLHFLVEVNPPLCRLLDMNSANGTFVNNQEVTEENLKDGDFIQGGKTLIRVRIESDSEPILFDSWAPSGDGRMAESPLAVSDESSFLPRPPDIHAMVRAASVPKPVVAAAVPLAPPVAPPPPEQLAKTAPLPKNIASLREPPTPALPQPGSDPFAETVAMPTRAVSLREPASKQSRAQASLPTNYRERIRRTPQPFQGFQIVQEIGRGGMGIVYQAIRDSDGAVVALKTIRPAAAGSEKDVERFLREAKLLESLQHPNIVAFREMGANDGTLYFAMDFVDGQDLKKIMSESPGPLPIPRAVNLVRQLIDALDYAHKKGIVHRDIKPANLLVANENGRETLSVTDFGLARTYQSSRISGLTTTGQIGGTTPFMAPEQIILFRDVKPTADQYAVAATLYHLITKTYVYDFPKTISAQLVMVLQAPPIPIEKRRSDVPPALAQTIHRGLSRQPEDRFPDLNAFRAALGAF